MVDKFVEPQNNITVLLCMEWQNRFSAVFESCNESKRTVPIDSVVVFESGEGGFGGLYHFL